MSINEFRRRAEYESTLLMQRSQIILTFNGLALVAVGLSDFTDLRILISTALIMINIFWIWCGIDASRYINLLNNYESQETNRTDSERIRTNIFLPMRIRPTFLISVLIPIILEILWLLSVMISYFKD